MVTGLGAVSPVGVGVAASWDALLTGRSGVGLITRFDATGWTTRTSGEVQDFDPVALLGPKLARRSARFVQFALVAAAEAFAQAGLDEDPGLQRERLGVFIGTAIGGIPEICDSHTDVVERGPRGVSPLFIPSALTNIASGQVAIAHRAKGPSGCPSTACAAGNHGIGMGFDAIRTGSVDVAIVGGAEGAIAPLTLAGFQNMRALSRWPGEPRCASRPFDAERTGMVVAEGAGILVLESLEHAVRRGASILCEVAGFASTTDVHHITAPSPDGNAAARCMTLALQSAGIAPEQVQYVNAHGTGTPMNDVAETRAIRGVFSDHAERLLISSTKGATGHMLGAAGGFEAVATVRALQTGWVPPTLHLETADPLCDLDYVAGQARHASPRVALSNAFGFGGANAVVALRRWEEE